MITNYVVARATIIKALDDISQMDNIFHSKCLINENMCSLVIDSGSCTNVSSAPIVYFLKLPTNEHITLYMI